MDRTTRFASRWILLGFVLSICPGLVGCGSSAPTKTAKVTGKLTDASGAPVAGASISFTGTGSKAYGPAATSEADGSYSLSTFDTGDGAPPGEYAITVNDAAGGSLKVTPNKATVEDKANTIDLKVEGGGGAAAPPATP